VIVKAIKLKEQQEENIFFRHDPGNSIFKLIFESSDLGIAITDSEGTLLLTNPQFIKIESLSRDRLDFSKLLNESDLTKANQTSFHNYGFGFLKITRIQFTQHSSIHYLWIVLHDSEAETNNKLGILLNLYRSFIDTTFEIIFRTNREGKILFANRLFLKHFGFLNYKKVKASGLKELFVSAEKFLELTLKLESENRVTAETVVLKKVDGSLLIGLLNGSLYNDAKGEEVINWSMLNISSQKESEDNLKSKNDQLAKLNHQMEKFLYSTSHDLRSPITTILGLVNLQRMDSTDAVVLDYVSKIEKSALKLDKLIKDIMSFSRATYQRTGSEKIDFEQVVWRLVNIYRADPTANKIDFEVKAKEGYPFYTDLQRLDIILENVIRNAVQFYDANKSKPFIKILITVDLSEALIEIIDNGIGIGKQHIDQICNMFYKASHLSKGAGLGLFIVKETLEKMRGTINIESEIGFGTVVRITIPNDHKGILINRKLGLQNPKGKNE